MRQTQREPRDQQGRVGPPYTFKLVKGRAGNERIRVLEPCVSYTIVKQWDDDAESDDPDEIGAQVGWELLLTRKAPSKGQRVRLPQQGHTVYVENLNGKTVQTFRWPEKAKKQEHVTFRVMDQENDPADSLEKS